MDALKKTYIDDVIAGNDPEAVAFQQFDDADTIRVAVTGDRSPMDYIAPDGVPMDFNTALIEEIASRLHKNIELVNVDSGARAFELASGSVDIVFWSEGSNFDNWERASAEDRPAGTVATDSYLSAPHRYVILDTSPLAEILEPLP